MKLDILYVRPGGSGWGPVAELVHLAAQTFHARVIDVDDRGEVSALRKAAASLPRVARLRGRHLLVIAPNPAVVAYLAHPRLWFPGYESTAVWIIDSFWTDRTPRILRQGPHVDHVFITDPGLVQEWRCITGKPVDVLPWGADTEKFPLVDGERPVDLLRLGRQPAAWDDDPTTAADAAAHDLVFAGRPPLAHDPLANHANVRQALLQAKTVLAFSNLVSPASYTHPTRDYLTGRWMDALAAGCLVVGAAPSTAESVLWPGATREISPSSRDDAWPLLREIASAWTPEDALERQHRARQRLDWRRRLHRMASVMGWETPRDLATPADASTS
ncbi:glycosyltransferase [Micrococcus porci]|uniref:glycosyltransferase n=1 Tax=Micrococcus porci TaxID=2856555 RepID=UPI003CF53AE2